MLALEQPMQLAGFSWLSLRQFMLDGRLTLFRLRALPVRSVLGRANTVIAAVVGNACNKQSAIA